MILILGAGISGLSASYHIGHDKCIVLEKENTSLGHLRSNKKDGFIWDQGPHVSFTNNSYVQELFAKSLNNKFLEYEVRTGNYYKGHWIDHPAQSNLYQVPEPLRKQCVDSFLEARQTFSETLKPEN